MTNGSTGGPQDPRYRAIKLTVLITSLVVLTGYDIHAGVAPKDLTTMVKVLVGAIVMI
jgi:hypothetical protein